MADCAKGQVGVQVNFDGWDGVCHAGASIPFPFLVVNNSPGGIRGDLVGVARSDNLREPEVLARWEAAVELGVGGRYRAGFNFVPPRAGFYRLSCTLRVIGGPTFVEEALVGYKPQLLSTPLTAAADFTGFWQRRIAELAAVAPDYKIVADQTLSTDEVDVYAVEMGSLGGMVISGWYSVPKNARRPLAATLALPGYTGAMRAVTRRRQTATLALDPRGHGRSRRGFCADEPEFMFVGLGQDPRDYVYAGVSMDCLRGIDFLAARAEVDPDRIGVEGVSQGGGLALITAALDRRVAFCAADIPWLCDWVNYDNTEAWALREFPLLLQRRPDLSKEGLLRTLSYVDALNFAEGIKCPVLVGIGLQDSTCPPRTIFDVYNRIGAAKEYRLYPLAGHGLPAGHRAEKEEWIGARVGLASL